MTLMTLKLNMNVYCVQEMVLWASKAFHLRLNRDKYIYAAVAATTTTITAAAAAAHAAVVVVFDVTINIHLL